MRFRAWVSSWGLLWFVGCAPASAVRVSGADQWRAHVQGELGDLSSLRFHAGVCQPRLRPDRRTLAEADFVEFLRKQNLSVRTERPRADLSYVIVTGAGLQSPVRLRVAVLNSADEAGRELHEALLQHGPGSWGVHRSNLAVLGPVSDTAHSLTFAAKTKLACWGVFTLAGRDDAYVVPGGYLEI